VALSIQNWVIGAEQKPAKSLLQEINKDTQLKAEKQLLINL